MKKLGKLQRAVCRVLGFFLFRALHVFEPRTVALEVTALTGDMGGAHLNYLVANEKEKKLMAFGLRHLSLPWLVEDKLSRALGWLTFRLLDEDIRDLRVVNCSGWGEQTLMEFDGVRHLNLPLKHKLSRALGWLTFRLVLRLDGDITNLTFYGDSAYVGEEQVLMEFSVPACEWCEQQCAKGEKLCTECAEVAHRTPPSKIPSLRQAIYFAGGVTNNNRK